MSIGRISIDVGANLQGLSIKMDESLSLLDRWSSKAEDKSKSLFDTLTEGLASGPMDMMDQTANAMGGLASAIDSLETPLSVLPQGIQDGIQSFGELNSLMSESIGLVGDIVDGFQPLLRMFPVIGDVGGKTFKKIGAGLLRFVKSPAGIAAGAVIGLSAVFYKNLDPAASVVTKIGNFFIDAYNKSLVLRQGVEIVITTLNTLKEGLVGGFKISTDFLSRTFESIGQVGTGNLGGVGKIWEGFLENGQKVGEDFVNNVNVGVEKSINRILNGTDKLTFDQVRNSQFFKGVENIGDWISEEWRKLFPEDFSHLDEMSDAWKEALEPLDGGFEKAKSALEQLQAAIRMARDEMSNKFLLGDIEGAEEAREKLDGLIARLEAIKTFEKGRIEINVPEIQTGFEARGGEVDNLMTRIKRQFEINDRIIELEVKLESNPQSLEQITAWEKELKSLRAEAEKLGIKLPQSFKMAQDAGSKFVGSMRSLGEEMKDILKDAFANKIVNLFEGSDKERIAEINDELREQREILTDRSATKEAREAAEARIKILEREKAAEKARGSVIVQTTKLLLDAAKEHLKAKLVEALSSAASAEAKKGLPGLITAGIAIAGFSALFSSKIPKLFQGGRLFKPTLFEGGEYPGAATNPEIVQPLNDLKNDIADAFRPFASGLMEAISMVGNTVINQPPSAISTYRTAPVIVNAFAETSIRDGELYTMIKVQHENELRTTGVNPLILQ